MPLLVAVVAVLAVQMHMLIVLVNHFAARHYVSSRFHIFLC